MERKTTIIIGLAFDPNMGLIIAGRMNDNPMTNPPTPSKVLLLNLSAITKKNSAPNTRIIPWMIGHSNASLAALPVAC